MEDVKMVKNLRVSCNYIYIILMVGVLFWLGACNSSSAPTSPVQTPAPSPESTGGAAPFVINISAENFKFDRSTISAYAGSEVTIEFNNKDSAPHNVAFYTDEKATDAIFVGDVITGPQTITYTFKAPINPGIYFFRCDIHPNMNGEFIVAGTSS